MSDGDVSLIRDEDVLRRMWQQTEDFGRKKEIRAHMYRLREERLRDLYSPEPPALAPVAKGCQFTSPQGHVKSFADQSFQSMKSKEVRDAGSPPKEFTYRGQDLKELSNAGWNVESENKTTDDGHTHVKTVQANIEGKYDVEGGQGQFAAIDQQKKAVTEYHDENSSLKRNESSSNTAAHEQVVRKTDDGTHFSSSTTSSSSTSKVQQVSSTKHEVPYTTNEDYDQSQTNDFNTKRNEEFVRRKEVTNNYEQSLRRSNLETGELISRKIDYPDDNTKVIVETRCLPDGTRVTSTRREFRAPVIQSSRSEHHSQSQQTKSENRSYHTTSQKLSDVKESKSKVIRHNPDNDFVDIVSSQRNADDYDFKRDQQTRYLMTDKETHDSKQKTSKHRYEIDENVINRHDVSTKDIQTIKQQTYDTQQKINKQYDINEVSRSDVTTQDKSSVPQDTKSDIKDYEQPKDVVDRVHRVTRDHKVEEVVERKTSTERYQTTYQTDYSQKKISNDWSPTHQAWASTLRADTPTSTRPSTRASSPGGRTFQSSTSSLRSSVSPDKTYRKPNSRGGSPNKGDRFSPTRTVSDRYSNTNSTHSVTETKTKRYASPEGRPPHGKSPTRTSSSPDKKPQEEYLPRDSVSPDKRPQRSSASPERKPTKKTSPPDSFPRTTSPIKHQDRQVRPSVSPDRTLSDRQPTKRPDDLGYRAGLSPDRKTASTGYPRATSPSKPLECLDGTSTRPTQSPNRKSDYPQTKHDSSPHRSSISPERKPLESPAKEGTTPTSLTPVGTPAYQGPNNRATSPSSNIPRTSPSIPFTTDSTQMRPSSSPERKLAPQKDITPRQNVISPDKNPGYMRPTASTKTSPTYDSPNSQSPQSYSPERKYTAEPTPETRSTKLTKVNEDHYKFIDEETKMYTRTIKKDMDEYSAGKTHTVTNNVKRYGKSPSPGRSIPSEDTSDNVQSEIPRSTLRKHSRSPSPPKGPVSFTQDQGNLKCIDATIQVGKHSSDVQKHQFTEDVTKRGLKDKVRPSPNKKSPSPAIDSPTRKDSTYDREPSPSKFETYDKKHRRSQEIDEVTRLTKEEFKHDSLTRERSSSPRKSPGASVSPTKKTPRESTSPNKSITKETRYKNSTDFIKTERKTEEINKKSASKDRPRQLITPSTSPTRKSKLDETAPSTGQSSPTTSVSGFVYFSSPRPLQTLVTDLDDQETYIITTENDQSITSIDEIITVQERPQTLQFNRSPSPSKIPCRSPSPEKRVSPTAENLPRKSSLKKPTNYTSQVSPTEKPPSSFRISPTTTESQEHLEHKVVKKDHPEMPNSDSAPKSKPPLERRETYEERCRKILGMMDDDKKGDLKKLHSPSTTPHLSPNDKDHSTFHYPAKHDTEVTGITETEFIQRERDQVIKDRSQNARKSSRDSSPIKLQDIITQTQERVHDVTKTSESAKEVINTKYVLETCPKETTGFGPSEDKPARSSNSPEKRFHKENSSRTHRQTPDRKTQNDEGVQRPRTVSPSKSRTKPGTSPERKPNTRILDSTSQQPTERVNSTTLIKQDTYDVKESKFLKKQECVEKMEKIQTIKSNDTDITKPARPIIKNTTQHDEPKGKNRISPVKDLFTPTEDFSSSKSNSATLLKQDTYDVEKSLVLEEEDRIDRVENNITIKSQKTNITNNTRYAEEKTPQHPEPQGRGRPTAAKDMPSKPTTLIKQETYDIGHTDVTDETKLKNQTHYEAKTTDRSPLPKDIRSPTKDSRSPKKNISSREPSPSKIVNADKKLLKQETYDVDDSIIFKTTETTCQNLVKTTPLSKPASTVKQPEVPKRSRTPSPTKTTKVIVNTEELLISEREQEILDRVQKSLRKLSPNRTEKSPSRGKSPPKSTTSLQDLDITTNEYVDDFEITTQYADVRDNVSVIDEDYRLEKPKDGKQKEPIHQQSPSKRSSRNVSPVKKTTGSFPTKVEKTPDSPNKSRSISPKKPLSSFDRPQSPQVTKTSGIKPREQIQSPTTRKPSIMPSPTKTDKSMPTSDSKKYTNIMQNSFTKTSSVKTTNKSLQSSIHKPNDTEPKRATTPKTNAAPKRDNDTKVTRTASDISLKPKKPSPQRMKSKPEIQVHDVKNVKTAKQTTTTTASRLQKPTITVPQTKFPSKPKSATALNTSTEDDDDIIVDVQQAKSSRENSPDRICPTPINFADDVGTPRFPDEVNEPDDDFRQRTYHTIHETESLVDDIVEICEEDELFVKKTDHVTDSDECLLSVNDKVSKFTNKIDTVNKKDATKQFKDTEKKVHSDFVDENLKSDECLLSVSEKVNKFAKGPRDTKESRSPSRRIVDEYDKNTTYQDDYTKLSVNDKAHLFVETAENIKVTKTKPAQKVQRPDITGVDESLKTDDCLLSVSDKVNKFVKTAEQFLTQTLEVDEKEKKIKEQHDLIMQKIVENVDDYAYVTKKVTEEVEVAEDTEHKKVHVSRDEKRGSFSKETTSSLAKVKNYPSPNIKPSDKTPTMKITALRSSEAVKKAKALFENIATTQKNDTAQLKTTKLTDIGVINKSPRTDSTIVLHPSSEDGLTDVDSDVDGCLTTENKERPNSKTPTRPQTGRQNDEKPRSSPTRLTTPEVPRTRSPTRQSVEITTIKTTSSRHPHRSESPNLRPESEKMPQDEVPSYQRPTKTSLIKEETKVVEEAEVSSRRGSGKFGVELRRTSVERSTVSSERRRSVEHLQPCIEDIYDLDLLEQMLEKVVGYEQRRRIRAQMRVAKKMVETDNNTTHTKTTKHVHIIKTRSPDRRANAKSPERQTKSTPQRTTSPERQADPIPQLTVSSDRQAKSPPKSDRNQTKELPFLNGHAKESVKIVEVTRLRTRSPEKSVPKTIAKTRSPVRHPSPEKKTRTTSPTKMVTPKPKSNRFTEYATAYMKKAGMNETSKVKFESQTKKSDHEINDRKAINQVEETKVTETKQSATSRINTERKSSREVIDVVRVTGKRTPSSEKMRSPERQGTPTERLREKSPSPVKRQISDSGKKETLIKTVIEIDKKVQPKSVVQEDKPSWIINRNLKKITSETRSFSSKKIEKEKPKYRAPSPSKVIAKPIDVITSSYGPGPLDADGKPLFGIKALRNGATNYQVKGTVIRQEYHSRNGGSPEGSVSVTAYSTSPEELERLLQAQGERPSRLHGLAAITTTKKFGGDTGTTYRDVHTREERVALDQFTHSDRRAVSHSDCRIEDITDVTSTGQRDRLEIEDSQERVTGRQERIEDTQERVTGRHERTEDKQERGTGRPERTYERQERVTGRQERTEDNKDRVSSRQDRLARQERIKDSQERVTSKRERVTSTQERTEERQSGDTKERVRGRQESLDKKEETRAQRTADRQEKTTRREVREDRKTVRQSSVKSLTEKYIKSASDTSKSERSTYPKAGLILRTATMKDSVSSDSSAHAGLARTDSEHSLGSIEDTVVSTTTDRHGARTVTASDRHGARTVTTTTTTTRRVAPTVTRTMEERSFLDSSTKVTGVQDILTRMKNADIVIQEGDTTEDREARALLNKFLGATVLMSGMQNYVADKPGGKVTMQQETVRSTGGKVTSSRSFEEADLEQCWDERVLRKLLDECTDYEQRRRLRARIRTLMAEQEACASAVTEALAAAGEATDGNDDAREEEEVTTVTSSVRRDSSDKTVSSSTTTTKTSKVIESMTRPAPKPVSPFAKFRQLEKQNSTNSPNSPKTPQSPSSPTQPYFKFTDPALQASALTIKERLLQWCRDKTRDYENVKLENFSTSWADGLAFCALVHHFLPDAFDYGQLTPDKRRHNFTLAFKIADEKAGIYPLLDVEDMVAMRKPDWKCVFTYVQAIHRRFRDQQ